MRHGFRGRNKAYQPHVQRQGEPQSGLKAKSAIGQKEVRQREHHMMLCIYLCLASVSCLSIMEQILDDAEYMLDLATNGGFAIFRFARLVLAAAAEFFQS